MNPVRLLRRTVLAITVAALGAIGAQGQPGRDDTLPTAKGDLTIHPIGHAAVLLTWNGRKILVDPAPVRLRPGGRGPQAGAGRGRGRGPGTPPPPSPQAIATFTSLGTPDLILITHAHGDHFNPAVLSAVVGPRTVLGVTRQVYDLLPAALKPKAKVLANGDHETLAGIPVQAVPAYNISPEKLHNHPKGVGNGYVLTLGGKRVYLAGDTEEAPELKHLAGIDVAFIPMNAPTETEQAAAQWVRDFRPKIVYPYHYSNADLAPFVKAVGNASTVRLRNWYPAAN